MNKSMMVGMALGVAVAAGGGVAAYSLGEKGPAYAKVLSAKAVMQNVRTPRQDCQDVTRTVPKPVQDQNRVAGSVIGAVVGGVLGHQVGGGDGKKLATVAAAAAGGYAGNQVQKNLQQQDLTTVTEHQCQTVYDKSQKLVGYDVSYQIGDKVDHIRMDHKPGDRIPLKDGQLVLDGQ
ncbi:glycine zipper 2TM domain-containing protein [Gallaecimonas kandeliae]|uniref:glycine zipper 2TM domain-containing protein n=1 Tax=Gallaecimonas kandeliae TaxID=3029055 RepID=UPI002649DC07|nr:glycine zipper 2TM domain-containing protein [Gallaecimonas kandeliae]WKE63919.1 glycine zipper 2TM domain-containing protein [Gallaecimonas kandeliae]